MSCSVCEEHGWERIQPAVYNDSSGRPYCIFHTPADEQCYSLEEFNLEVARYINTCLSADAPDLKNEKLPPSVKIKCELAGTQFPGDISFRDLGDPKVLPSINFSEAVFHGRADFRGIHFVGDAWFVGTKFHNSGRFEDATFLRDAWFGKTKFSSSWFSGCDFKHNVSFAGSEFENAVKFHKANFRGQAEFKGTIFNGTAIFNSTTFHSKSDFSQSNFSDIATFKYATFKLDVNFTGIEIGGGAGFHHVKFHKDALFEGGTFTGESSFISVYFGGKAIFNSSDFKLRSSFKDSEFHSRALFQAVHFHGNVDYSAICFHGFAQFDRSEFVNAKFINAKFLQDSLFAGAVFNGETLFNKACFEGATRFKDAEFKAVVSFVSSCFESYANFVKTSFHGNAMFKKVVFNGRVKFSGSVFNSFLSCSEAFFRNAAFHAVEVKGDANFSFTLFGKMSFNKADFHGRLDLTKACIENEAFFMRMLARKPVYFDQTIFESGADFSHSVFKEYASFEEVELRSKSSFKGAFFENWAYFDTPLFDSVDFSGCITKETIVIDGADLRKVSLRQMNIESYRFSLCRWANDPSHSDLKIVSDHKAVSCERLENIYRRLKKKALDEGDQLMASNWHFQEKEMSLQVMKKPNAQWWVKWFLRPLLYIYKGVSGYGEAPGLAGVILLGLALTTWLLLGFAGISGDQQDSQIISGVDWSFSESSIERFGEVFRTGLQNMLLFKYDSIPYKPIDGWAVGLLFILTRLFLPVQAALFAFAVRNKFRR